MLAEPLDEARARIAVVDDEPHVFGTTLRNNLTLARPARLTRPCSRPSVGPVSAD